MPAHMRNRIRDSSYRLSPTWDAEQNPVKKVLLSIHENEGELFIQAIRMNEEGVVMVGNNLQGQQGGSVVETVAAIQHHVSAILREQFEIKAELETFRKEERVVNRVLSQAIQRLSRQPARILGRGRQEQPAVVEDNDNDDDVLHAQGPGFGVNRGRMCTFFPPEGPLSSQIRDSARKNVCKMPEIMHSTCCVNSILPFRLRMSLRNSLHLSDFLQEIGIRHSPDMQSSHASSIRTRNLPFVFLSKPTLFRSFFFQISTDYMSNTTTF